MGCFCFLLILPFENMGYYDYYGMKNTQYHHEICVLSVGYYCFLALLGLELSIPCLLCKLSATCATLPAPVDCWFYNCFLHFSILLHVHFCKTYQQPIFMLILEANKYHLICTHFIHQLLFIICLCVTLY
jgi:hypothetical protein